MPNMANIELIVVFEKGSVTDDLVTKFKKDFCYDDLMEDNLLVLDLTKVRPITEDYIRCNFNESVGRLKTHWYYENKDKVEKEVVDHVLSNDYYIVDGKTVSAKEYENDNKDVLEGEAKHKRLPYFAEIQGDMWGTKWNVCDGRSHLTPNIIVLNFEVAWYITPEVIEDLTKGLVEKGYPIRRALSNITNECNYMIECYDYLVRQDTKGIITLLSKSKAATIKCEKCGEKIELQVLPYAINDEWSMTVYCSKCNNAANIDYVKKEIGRTIDTVSLADMGTIKGTNSDEKELVLKLIKEAEELEAEFEN